MMLARVVIFAAVVLLAVGALSQSGFFERFVPAEQPAPPPQSGSPSPVVLTADASGHYFVDGSINGRPARFVVDTGATTIALSAETAQRMGLTPDKSAFTATVSTANGPVAAARLSLGEVRVGAITRHGVDAIVLPPGALATDLLGMSFLRRLGGLRVNGRQMVLQP
jgi:aspartyl protease family protein